MESNTCKQTNQAHCNCCLGLDCDCPQCKTIKVIFRKWKDGDVIALFPEEPGTSSPDTCMSYAHEGQHGAANPMHIIQETKLSTPDEYADLLAELERIGYNLEVIPRHYRRHYLIRSAKINNINKLIYEIYNLC